jgi:cyclin-dependent kinase 7
MVSDLAKIVMDKKNAISEGDIVFIFKQIVSAVDYLHKRWIMHRVNFTWIQDLKPDNILVDRKGNLKLTDFGLAREFGLPDKELTRNVATRWYRPPEILFGSSFYGESIDMWALGCILAELYLREPIFRGEGDIDQLSKIFGIIGTPDDENWPNAKNLPYFFEFEKTEPVPLKSLMPTACSEAIDLISNLLRLDPQKRLKIEEVLSHPFFNKPIGERSYTKRLAELDMTTQLDGAPAPNPNGFDSFT